MRRSRNNGGLTLAELAARVGGTVEGDGDTIIRSVAPVETAGADQISFIANEKYSKFIATTKAGALILAPAVSCERVPVLRHANPYYAFALVGDLLYPDEPLTDQGIAPTAVIHPDAHVDPGAELVPTVTSTEERPSAATPN